MTKVGAIEIRPLDAVEASQRLDAFCEILIACVEGGASIGFLAPMAREQAAAYWLEVFAQVRTRGLVLLGAFLGDKLVGTVQIKPEGRPNGRHRIDVSKLLVAPGARRKGVGRALMEELEAIARSAGRTLAILDTRTGDPSEKLYLSMGYKTFGVVPRYARDPDGAKLADCTFMYKELER